MRLKSLKTKRGLEAAADDASTKQYCFNEDSDLKWGLIQYPEDKIEIKVNLGINETIDVTEWYFGGKEGGAPGFIEDGIKESIIHVK